MVSDIWLRLGLTFSQATSSIISTLNVPKADLIPASQLCLADFLISPDWHCHPLDRQNLGRTSFRFSKLLVAPVLLREIYQAGQFRCGHRDGEPERQALPLSSHAGEWPARPLQQPWGKHRQGRWVGGGPCSRDFRFLFLFPVFSPCSIFIVIWLHVLFENLHLCILWLDYLWAILKISLVARAMA